MKNVSFKRLKICLLESDEQNAEEGEDDEGAHGGKQKIKKAARGRMSRRS